MKYLAFIISFYIICLSAVPMAAFTRPEIATKDCGKKCCKHMPEKDTKGCNETCSPFSCCLKTIVMYQPEERHLNPFIPENFIQNNFRTTQIFVSFRDFDIWHPPRVV